MAKDHWSEETKRVEDAIEKQVVAQNKVRKCLSDGSVGPVKVIHLMESLYERALATSEAFRAIEADSIARWRRLQRDSENTHN